MLYSLNNISGEWLLQHELTDEALIFGFKIILSFHIKGLNHHIIINPDVSIILILLSNIIYMKVSKKYICDDIVENNTQYMMKHSAILICIFTLHKIFADILVYLLFDYLNI